MSGIGSDSSYDPSRGGYTGGGYGTDSLNVDSLVSGMGAAFSSLGSMTRSAAQSASAIVNDPATQQSLQGITGSVRSTGSSLWGSLSASVNSAVQSISQPDNVDGLAEFNREMHAHRSVTGSQYTGFGSDSLNGGGANFGAAPVSGGSSTLEEAPGLPGEDRNGIERLTGESDEQYVLRQTRLRDEAKARMAAKFGGGGMSSASSASYNTGVSSMPSSRVPSAPSSNGSAHVAASAPTSGNFSSSSTPNRTPTKPLNATKVPIKMDSSDDFFASFGT